MNNRKYIPHPQTSVDEHYATFEEMISKRPDVVKSMNRNEHTAYHVE